MCKPVKHTDAFHGIIMEIGSAMSSLYMPPDPILPEPPDAVYMADKFVYAQHAQEHLRAALEEWRKAWQEHEKMRTATWAKRIEILEERNRRTDIAACSRKQHFSSAGSRLKSLLLEIVQITESAVKLLTLNFYQPSWHAQLLFSKWMSTDQEI